MDSASGEQQLNLAEIIEKGVAAFDSNWRFKYLNTHAERFLQRPAGHLIGKVFWDEYPALVGTPTEKECRRVMVERSPGRSVQFYQPLGRWFEARYFPAPDGGLVVLFNDITEAKNAEETLPGSEESLRLRASEARWRSLANAMPQFIWVATSFGSADFINDYWFEYTGITYGELSLATWIPVLHPDDLPNIEKMWRLAVASQSEQNFEYRVRRASDGAWRWHLGWHRPERSEDGRIVRWIGTAVDIHDRKEAEASIRALEERQRLAVEAGKIGLWDWDVANDRAVLSDRIYEYHGLSRSEFENQGGEAFFKSIHAGDRERVREAIRLALDSGRPYELEYRAQDQRGAMRWLSSRATVVRDDDGHPTRMIGTTIDVTDRVLAQRQLQESTDQLNALFEHAPEALLVADSGEQFIQVNSAACELLGYTAAELLSLHVVDLLRPADIGGLARLREELLAGRTHCGEWDLRHKDGTWIPVEIHGTRLPDGRLQSFVRDLRERRRLSETALRLAAIVESSDDAIISNDLEGRIQSWNAGAERIFGYTAAEVMGRRLSVLAPPQRKNEMHSMLERIRRGERLDHYETVRRAKDGRDLVVSLSISPIQDAAGRIVGASKIARDITERKRAEEALQRSEQELRFVFDHAPAFIAYLGIEGRYVRVNKAYEDWFGLTAGEIRGKHIRDAFGDEYFAAVQPLIEKVKLGESVSFDVQAVRPNGEIHQMWGVYSPDRDPQGVVHGFIALLQDVTERFRQERAIRDRDEERQRLLAALPDVIARFSPDLRMRYVSPAIERFAGVSSEFLIGKTHLEMGVPEPVANLLDSSLRKIFATNQTDHVELEMQSPLLGMRYMKGDGIPEADASGNVKSVLTILRDITEQRRAEQEREILLLRETEARQTAELLNRVGPILAAELDAERLVQSVTDLATKLVGAEFGAFFHNVINDKGESYILYTLSGAPREAFAGFPMPRNTEVFGPTFRGQGIVRSDDITRDARYGKMEPYRGMPKGHLPVKSYLAAPVVSRSGEVLGGLFFGHSAIGQFTERHEALLTGLAAQAAIALDNARLFERSQRAQNELRRSNEDLRRANKDLETFAYSASHDLQEPLRNIAIAAQLLDRRLPELDPETRDFLKSIHEGARRMKALMEDLLSYTWAIRPTEGPVPVVNSEHILDTVVSQLRPLISDVQGNITRSALPPVRVMEIHLTQILQNLISNALKYRREEAPRIHVSGVERDGFVIFSVTDNGIGIEDRFKKQIFGLFKRLHTREEYPGSGVGLAICQRIVEQYGGRIWVQDSKPGEGSVFSFSLPMR